MAQQVFPKTEIVQLLEGHTGRSYYQASAAQMPAWVTISNKHAF